MQSSNGICSQNRSAYMGVVSAVLYRLVVPARPAWIFVSYQMFAAANISTLFLGEIKNLTQLISVLSLPFKFVHNHKSCPNSAVTLLSLQIEAVLTFGQKPWKSYISAMGSAWVGVGGLISATLLARPVTRNSLRRNSCWPHSRVLSWVSLSPPSIFLCVAWSCTVKMITPLVRYNNRQFKVSKWHSQDMKFLWAVYKICNQYFLDVRRQFKKIM